MLEQLLEQHAGELIAAITKNSELEPAEAKSLLPPALDQITNQLGGGASGIDLQQLLGGGSGAIGALLAKLDVAKIAGAAGLDQAKAQNGLAALIPVVVSLLGDKAGGAEGLMSMLGGSGGAGGGLAALGGMAGKLFGK